MQYINTVLSEDAEKSLAPVKDLQLTPVAKSMQQELDEAANELKKKQKKELEKLKNENLSQFAIKGSEQDWGAIYASKGKKNIVSVKR